jgi:hypothetical protein
LQPQKKLQTIKEIKILNLASNKAFDVMNFKTYRMSNFSIKDEKYQIEIL